MEIYCTLRYHWCVIGIPFGLASSFGCVQGESIILSHRIHGHWTVWLHSFPATTPLFWWGVRVISDRESENPKPFRGGCSATILNVFCFRHILQKTNNAHKFDFMICDEYAIPHSMFGIGVGCTWLYHGGADRCKCSKPPIRDLWPCLEFKTFHCWNSVPEQQFQFRLGNCIPNYHYSSL